MNWYKHAQLKETLPYFKEFEEYGESGNYIPDEESLSKHLQDLNTSIVSDIGQGDSGVAYQLSNGDILKITTNDQEGKVAQYLINNPIPCIVQYKHIWKEGDLYFIIMEKLDQMITDVPDLADAFRKLDKILDENHCYNPQCAYKIITNPQYTNLFLPDLYQMIIDYLLYLKEIPMKIFDFLDPNNIGLKNGKIKFFDIT